MSAQYLREATKSGGILYFGPAYHISGENGSAFYAPDPSTKELVHTHLHDDAASLLVERRTLQYGAVTDAQESDFKAQMRGIYPDLTEYETAIEGKARAIPLG